MSEEKRNDAVKKNNEEFSLNDDRRVKVLSPGAMVAKRFFRNRIAMVGLFVLIAMFLFSFVGGLISPYGEDQLFYRTDILKKEYASAIQNTEFRYSVAEGQNFPSIIQAKFILAQRQKDASFEYDGKTYTVTEEGTDFYSISLGGTVIGIAYKDVFSVSDQAQKLSFNTVFAGIKAFSNAQTAFSADGVDYTLASDGLVSVGDKEFGYISRFVVQPLMADIFLTREFKDKAIDTMSKNGDKMMFTDESGKEHEYFFNFDPKTSKWTIREETESRVYDTYSAPSKKHWLGTDRNGMDMLTRLMYGGRVSLMIGFIVEIIY